MNLFLEGKQLEFSNDWEGIEQTVNIINDYVAKNELILEYIEINDLKVYDNIIECMKQNINSIDRISIGTLTKEEWIKETINTMHNYLVNGIDKFKELGNKFYGGTNKELWDQFNQFLEGIGWTISMLENIQNNLLIWKENNNIKYIVKKLNNQLRNLELGFRSDDKIEIRDTIMFELIPSLIEVIKEIEALDFSKKRNNKRILH